MSIEGYANVGVILVLYSVNIMVISIIGLLVRHHLVSRFQVSKTACNQPCHYLGSKSSTDQLQIHHKF